jgi:hypothetical protein
VEDIFKWISKYFVENFLQNSHDGRQFGNGIETGKNCARKILLNVTLHGFKIEHVQYKVNTCILVSYLQYHSSRFTVICSPLTRSEQQYLSPPQKRIRMHENRALRKLLPSQKKVAGACAYTELQAGQLRIAVQFRVGARYLSVLQSVHQKKSVVHLATGSVDIVVACLWYKAKRRAAKHTHI